MKTATSQNQTEHRTDGATPTETFRRWLEQIPPADDQPDWNPITEIWDAPKPKEVDSEAWNKWVFHIGWHPLVAAVANATETDIPDVRHHMALIGPPMIGKSAWLKATLPDDIAELGKATIPPGGVSPRSQTIFNSLSRRVFVEAADATLMSRADWGLWNRLNNTKSYITRYSACPTVVERRWVPYITANQKIKPRDPSGCIRYSSVHVKRKTGWEEEQGLDELCLKHLGHGHNGSYGAAVAAKTKDMREGLWAAAKALYAIHGTDFLRIPAEPQATVIGTVSPDSTHRQEQRT